ncbi:hypothetical protein [Rhodococcus sp. 14-2496-1d]|nr:hypothetical protein [Rhodococcus sp. 14-2496-1d]
MSLHRNISAPTDKRAYSRAYVVTILAGLSLYPVFVGICHAAQALGWLA